MDLAGSGRGEKSTQSTGGFPIGHALVVGIADYPAQIGPLPQAVRNDAHDVYDLLVSSTHCGYDPSKVALLLDTQATLANLRTAMAALIQSAGPDDTVLIYFSGHGARLGPTTAPTSALVPIDCQGSRPDATCLTEQEFSESLAKIEAKKLLILLDACHAGGAASFKYGEGDPIALGYDEKTLARLSDGAGRVLVASSRASEYSTVFNGARNSVFTQHILEALRGGAYSRGDGLIRVFDLFNYVSEKVRQSVPGAQHPIFKASELEDNFPVGRYPAGTKQTIATAPMIPAGGGQDDGLRQLVETFAQLYPAGPTDQEIWQRAGGDLSRLNLGVNGHTAWFSALRLLQLGGGGRYINKGTLVKTAREDFPHHPSLIVYE